MKIFFRNRLVRFIANPPEHPSNDTLIVPFQSEEKLKEDWIRFRDHEVFNNFFILDQRSENDPIHESATDLFSRVVLQGIDPNSPGLNAFLNLFTLLPAAGGLVKNESGEILFIHRLGRWDLPKGKIDKKELTSLNPGVDLLMAANMAAIREVREETGLKKVSAIREISSTWHIYREKNKEILKRTFWFEMLASTRETLKPQVSEGIFLVKWVPVDAMSYVLMNTYASISDLLSHTIGEQS